MAESSDVTVKSSTVQRLLLVVLCALLAAIGAVLLTSGGSKPAAQAAAHDAKFDGPALPAGLVARNFTLTDQNGQRVSLSQYRGKVVVITFIHSLCKGACPLMVEQIKGALNTLPKDGKGIPTLGISVDPGEDTPRNRKMFLAQHQMTGRLNFLNGPRSTLDAVWKNYAMQPDHGKIDDHSTYVLLIDKHGYERVGFPVSLLTPEELAHDITVLQREKA
jgi:cytochrome oxidase Cu insertion factor (SCO1/SenC/PrrC family)